MDSVNELFDLRNELKDIGACDETNDAIFNKLYGDTEKTEIFLIEEYDDSSQDRSYSRFVIDVVGDRLLQDGVVFILLRNSSGDDRTLVHEFTIFKIDNDYYRIESYGITRYVPIQGDKMRQEFNSLYCTRIVEWPTFRTDLSNLIEIEPGNIRLAYWNGLFSANETVDNDEQIDVTLYVPE